MNSGIDVQAHSIRLPTVEGYEIDGYLGEGGMGTVYRARRSGTQQLVALKMLKRVDATGIYRMKREFRTFADIVHPNLVRLFELNSDAENWFFTMELLSGRPLLDHLGVERIAFTHSSMVGFDAPTERSSGERRVSRTPWSVESPLRQFDPETVRDRFRQLAEAARAIHRASKLHCDIKPSNVLVEDSGRLVVLDFGVSMSFDRSQPQKTLEAEIGGTPEYMSPEQAAGKALGPESDWYAVGAVLYETLCGRLPFSGPRLELIRRKQSELPPRPSTFREGVPEDLETLCMALLAPLPEHRPTGNQVLEVLQQARHGAEAPKRARTDDRDQGDDEPTFVGRERELRALQSAFREVGPSSPVLVFVTGNSGIGKSALMQKFLGDVAREAGVVLLCGRCYERESVPYKGLDPVIDELSRFLRRLNDREVAELLPRDMSALSRVFPVFRRVPAIAAARGRSADSPDLVEIRRRATRALKELLARLADNWKLVIAIDDAQWGDDDSARLLTELLTPPDAPSLLTIVGARPDEQSPMVRELLHGQGTPRFTRMIRFVQVPELASSEATQLAEAVLGEKQRGLASLVAGEAQGNPFFVRELSLYANRHAEWQPSQAVSQANDSARLEPMLRERLFGLSAAHRRAVELVAVASQPIPQVLLAKVLVPEKAEARPIWDELREARLVRLLGSPDSWSVECYHDRVRETVLAGLSPEATAECHRLLVSAFECDHGSDPEVLLEHYRGAGDVERARRHVLASAAASVEALAFSRAVRLYRLALSLLPEPESRALKLGRKLADVLASDGRLEAAAVAYEDAAANSEGTEAIELRRLAAQHYLTSGNHDAGIRVLRHALRDVGLTYPSTPGAAIARLAWERLKLRFGGLNFRERESTELERARADVCFSAAVGLAMTDLLRTAAFSVQHLNLALKTGEPERVARGLAFEMGVAPGAGEEGLRWASRALPVAERLSDRHGTAYHRGLFFLAQGHVAHLNGQWKAAVEWLARAEGLLRESQTPDLHWALLSGHVLSLISAVTAGDLVGAAKRIPSLSSEARQRGELHRLALMAYPAVVLELAHDRPDFATKLLRELVRNGSPELFDLRDFTVMHCGLLIDRYCGRESDTWQRLTNCWPAIERSKLLVVNIVRIAALAERGSAALGQAERSNHSSFRRLAVRCARQLEREHLPHARALSGLLRARLESSRGDNSRALSILSETSLRLDSTGLSLHADCTRRVSASLMGGSMGGLLIAEADQRLRDQGVRDPARFAAMMVPGFSTSERRLLDRP